MIYNFSRQVSAESFRHVRKPLAKASEWVETDQSCLILNIVQLGQGKSLLTASIYFDSSNFSLYFLTFMSKVKYMSFNF